MRRLRRMLSLALVGAAVAVPARAQNPDWQYQALLGLKGGMTGYSVRDTSGASSMVFRPSAGADLMLSGRRVGLYFGYAQTLGTSDSTHVDFSEVSAGTVAAVGFTALRRVQAGMVFFPTTGNLQPYVGGGVVMLSLAGAGADTAGVAVADTAGVSASLSNRSSSSVILAVAGLQFRMRRLSLFGQVQFSPLRSPFVLGGTSTAVEFGARYRLASAREADVEPSPWPYQWFWGVKGGVVTYTLPSLGQVARAQVGAEWLITAKRTGLYLGVSQTVGVTESDGFTFSNISGTPTVFFDGMRRIQIAVLVFPTNGALQPYAGAGFVIETLPNATATGLSGTAATAAQNAVDAASSGGFFLTMVGAQLRMRKLALFGQAQISPQGRDFLLGGSSVSLEFGLRYALTGAREDDVTTRR